MALSQSSVVCGARLQSKARRAPRAAASAARAEASQGRRALLRAAAPVAALLAAGRVEAAIVNPAQESYGGLSRATGKAGSSTYASMSGYNLEGTNKTGIDVGRRNKLMAKAREAAMSEAAPAKK